MKQRFTALAVLLFAACLPSRSPGHRWFNESQGRGSIPFSGRHEGDAGG